MNWDNAHLFLPLILFLIYGNYIFLDILPSEVIFILFFKLFCGYAFLNVFKFVCIISVFPEKSSFINILNFFSISLTLSCLL